MTELEQNRAKERGSHLKKTDSLAQLELASAIATFAYYGTAHTI